MRQSSTFVTIFFFRTGPDDSDALAAGGGVFDVTIPKAGIYPFVSHSFASVMLGEVGLLNVGNVAGTMSH